MATVHCSGNTIAGTAIATGKHGSVALGYAGDCTPGATLPPLVTCDLEVTVLGGDGRFEGAEGSGRMIASVHPQQDVPDPAPSRRPTVVPGRDRAGGVRP